MKLKLKEKY